MVDVISSRRRVSASSLQATTVSQGARNERARFPDLDSRLVYSLVETRLQPLTIGGNLRAELLQVLVVGLGLLEEGCQCENLPKSTSVNHHKGVLGCKTHWLSELAASSSELASSAGSRRLGLLDGFGD